MVARGDPWDSVSAPAALALDGLRRDGYVDDDALDEVILDALSRLPGSVRGGGAGWGGGDGGIACARMAIAAMATAGSQRVSDMFLTRYAVRSGACAGLAQCFAVSADLASVGRSNELRALGQLSGKENGGPNEEDGGSSSVIEGVDAGAPARTTMNVPVLPRHPPRMLHLSDPDRYSAVAAVARAMGRHCAAAHNGALAALVDAHLDALRDSLEDGRSDSHDAGSLWQRSACAHVVVLNETIRGAGEVEPKRKAETSETVAASRGVLQEYLSREVWDLPTSFDDIPFDDISHARTGYYTLATLRDNALLTCLAAEGVGVIAQACGADFVRRGAFLPQALCPLLQKLGDPAATVSDTAGDVLAAIAEVGGSSIPPGERRREQPGFPRGPGFPPGRRQCRLRRGHVVAAPATSGRPPGRGAFLRRRARPAHGRGEEDPASVARARAPRAGLDGNRRSPEKLATRRDVPRVPEGGERRHRG